MNKLLLIGLGILSIFLISCQAIETSKTQVSRQVSKLTLQSDCQENPNECVCQEMTESVPNMWGDTAYENIYIVTTRTEVMTVGSAPRTACTKYRKLTSEEIEYGECQTDFDYNINKHAIRCNNNKCEDVECAVDSNCNVPDFMGYDGIGGCVNYKCSDIRYPCEEIAREDFNAKSSALYCRLWDNKYCECKDWVVEIPDTTIDTENSIRTITGTGHWKEINFELKKDWEEIDFEFKKEFLKKSS